MMTSGLVAEVQKLKDMGYHRGMVSMQGLGYKEILAYLDGEMPLEEAVRILKRDTRLDSSYFNNQIFPRGIARL